MIQVQGWSVEVLVLLHIYIEANTSFLWNIMPCSESRVHNPRFVGWFARADVVYTRNSTIYHLCGHMYNQTNAKCFGRKRGCFPGTV